MKNDKFCFSKSLFYLVVLVVAVVGAFYLMGYANSQKLGSNPKAAQQTASQFVVKSTNCKNVSYDSSKEEVWCVLSSITGSSSTMLKYANMVSKKDFASVKVTTTTCGSLGASFGKCVVFTTSNGKGSAYSLKKVSPTVSPATAEDKYATRFQKICDDKNTEYYKQTGKRYTIATVNTDPNDRTSRTKQVCVKVYGKPVYPPGSKVESSLTCVNQEVDAKYCQLTDSYLPETSCPSKASILNIKSIVSKISETSNSRFSLSPNYYGFTGTTGNCVLKSGELVKQQTVTGGNSIQYGGQCRDKVVSDDYCLCATWKSIYPEDECKNVIKWINGGDYDHE